MTINLCYDRFVTVQLANGAVADPRILQLDVRGFGATELSALALNIGLVHLKRAGDLARMSDAPTAFLEVFPLSHVPFRAQEQSQLQRLRGKLGKAGEL